MNDLLNSAQCRQIMADLADLLPRALRIQLPSVPGFDFEDDEHVPTRTRWDPVFTGGGIVSLLITDPAAPQTSLTKDVDLVLEIASWTDFVAMEDSLRRAGFTQDFSGNAPIVAWEWQGVGIDFLPHRPIPHMQTNRWFPYLIEDAEWVEVLPGRNAWRASAPSFIATKFEAFYSRGKSDFLMSKDMEDILAVIDGRSELLDEIPRSSPDVQGFIRQCISSLLSHQRFLECLPDLVPDDGREKTVMERMRIITG